MGTRFFYTIKTQFDFLVNNKLLVNDSLHDNMYRVGSFICSYTVYLFGSLFWHIFRFHSSLEKYEADSSEVSHKPDYHRFGSSRLQELGTEKSDGEGEDSVVTETSLSAITHRFYSNLEKYETNSSELSHKPDDHQIGSSNGGGGENFLVMETSLSASTNRYEFLFGKCICGFVEQPRTVKFIVHKLFVDSNDDIIGNTPFFDTGGCTDEDFQGVALEVETEVKSDKERAFVNSFIIDDVLEDIKEQEKLIEETGNEEDLILDDGVITVEEDFRSHELGAEKTEERIESLVNGEDLNKLEFETYVQEKSFDRIKMISGLDNSIKDEHDLLSNCHLFKCDGKEESICSKEEINTTINELSSNRINGQVFEPESLMFIDEEKKVQIKVAEPVSLTGVESCEFADEKAERDKEPEAVLMRDQASDSDDEYIELQPKKQTTVLLDEVILSTEELSKVEPESIHEKAKPKSKEESSFHEQKSSNSHVHNDTDYMFEHQDIIEQLTLELKLARTGGLPTIPEESESEELETPKTVQELKPMEIDHQKFEHKDLLEGIQKVYVSYLEKMRKLDILNFQTMHAFGLLQIKETVQLRTTQKSSFPTVMCILSQNLRLCKETAVTDPMKKVIADMHRDFETIYVGQLCLSWEIMHWQYRKVQEMQKDDYQVAPQYNQVAGEFQLFQVLIQRFLENEQFQGPNRIQNYVKNRCVLPSLLQVPLVKDDNLKEKGKNGDEEDTVTSQMLIEIIEQSMRVFWEFLRADKDETNFILQGHHHTRVNLQALVDLELLTDIRSDFQKKEKKLKDTLRSGNCIVKRLKRQQEHQVHYIHTLMVAQVELKLISRVLNMSKLTTDQLIWCHEKLDKINFCNRKVFVESSFLLFPY